MLATTSMPSALLTQRASSRASGRVVASAVAVLCFVIAAIVAGQGGGQGGGQSGGQNGGTQAAFLPAGTGLILGQVIDGVTGRPVGAALVTLTASAIAAAVGPGTASGGRGSGQAGSGVGARATTQTVIADANGRFVFHELPKATYALTAEYTGYASGALGQRRAGGPSQALMLDADQHVLNARIPLWKLASISGVVLDDNGEPMVGVSVRAMRQTLTLGRRRLAPSSSVTTDDRGAYRLSAMVAGDYVMAIPATTQSVPTSMVDEFARVALMPSAPGVDAAAIGQATAALNTIAQGLSGSGGPNPMGAGYRLGETQLQLANALTRLAPPPVDGTRIFAYQTTFYPSTTVASQAQMIALAPGDERTGIDMHLRLVVTSRVTGTLAGPGDVVPGSGLKLVPVDAQEWSSDSGYETATTSADSQGRFAFLGVPSGLYMLRGQRLARAADAGAPPVSTWWVESPVTVAGADVANVAVALHEGARVGGRVEFDGAAARPAPDRLQQITIALVSADGRGAPPAVRVGADGQFVTQQHVPGRYTLNVSAPSGWFLKSVTSGGRDVSQTSWVLESRDLGGVVVTYTDRPAQLSGQVQGAPVPDLDALVVMFPANHPPTSDVGLAPRMMRVARPTRTGGFSVANVPAGDYYVAAVPDALSNDWQEVQMLTKIARVATRVSLADGERQTVTLGFTVVK